MGRIAVACGVMVLLMGCSGDIVISQTQRVWEPEIPCCPDGTTDGQASGRVAAFTCTPDQPHRSSCTLGWAGDPGPFRVRAIQPPYDITYPPLSAGQSISPGPEGNGGGAWLLYLIDDNSAVIASTDVTLDS